MLPGVNAGSLVAALIPERIGGPPSGVDDTVGSTQAVTTLAAYVLLGAIAAWSHRRREVV